MRVRTGPAQQVAGQECTKEIAALECRAAGQETKAQGRGAKHHIQWQDTEFAGLGRRAGRELPGNPVQAQQRVEREAHAVHAVEAKERLGSLELLQSTAKELR